MADSNTFPTAQQSRAGARNDILIHNEIRDIEDAILRAVDSGYLEVQVYDTVMTDTTMPVTYVLSTNIMNDTFTATVDTGIIPGDMVKFVSTGTLPSPIQSVKIYYAANITNSTNTFKIYNTKIDAINGTNNIDLLSTGTGSLTGTKLTPSQIYFNVWKGTTIDRSLTDQMTQVITNFQNLGYSIVQKTNPVTNNTFLWEIQW